jgi:transposase
MLTSVIVFLHENARAHTAGRTGALLERLNWELFDHPPYSPDLAPSDHHLFTYLRKTGWDHSASIMKS